MPRTTPARSTSAAPVAVPSFDPAAGGSEPVQADAHDRPGAGPRHAGAARAIARHGAVIVAYAVPAVVLWWHAWAGHLGSTLTCDCGDAGQTLWFTAWPAYALAHGLDPFFSYSLQSPYGVNLLANAAATPVGLVLSPVTWLFGPVVSTNVALTMCPAISAWACWLACRRLVTWRPAAVVAGLLYGYSPFVVTNLGTGHVSLCLIAVPPLLVVAGREVLMGPAERRVLWGAAIGGLLALQFLISSEVLAITVVVGAPCAVAGAALVPRGRRPPGRALIRSGVVAAVVGAMLLAGPLWLALAGPQHLVGPPWPNASISGNALVSVWNPGAYRAPADLLLQLGGYEGAQGPPSAYLGVIVLALCAVGLAAAWRRRSAWLLTAGAAVSVALSWGSLLVVDAGHLSGVWVPWRVLGGWPLLDEIIPQRFSIVTDLAAALLVGVGLDALHRAGTRRLARASPSRGLTAQVRRHRGRLLVDTGLLVASAAAVGSLWWTYQVPLHTTPVRVPRWFTTAATRLPAGATVLTYPFPFPAAGTAEPMVWQAVGGMRIRLAGAYAKVPDTRGKPLSDHPHRAPYGILAGLSTRAGGPLPPDTPATLASLRGDLARWDVDWVVVTDSGRAPRLAVRLFTAALGRPPRHQDGSWVWRVHPDDRRADGGRRHAGSSSHPRP